MPEKYGLCPYLAPNPSRALAAFLFAVHILAFLAGWLNPLNIWLKLLISLGVLASFWLHFERLKAAPKIIGFRHKPDGSWDLHMADGTVVEASLQGSSRVNPWFVLLHFKAETGRHSMLVCRDSLESEEFRKLRVALRILATVE